MVKAPRRSKRATLKALKEQIRSLEEAISEKVKSGDIRGINAMHKKLSKLKKELYQLKHFRM